LKWFDYLPCNENIATTINNLKSLPANQMWGEINTIAKTRLDFTNTIKLDRAISLADKSNVKTLRLAILASATVAHLIPGIRVAGARHGLYLEVFCHDYGMALQNLTDPTSPLHAFQPDVVLISWTTEQLLGTRISDLDLHAPDALVNGALAELQLVRDLARSAFNCHIIQQTLLPIAPLLMGNNEHHLPGSPLTIVDSINNALKTASQQEKFDLLNLNLPVMDYGIASWFDPSLWYKGKQEISPLATPFYGELVLRLIKAQYGLSYKCLVLDLDNTLWGGVIGDDGLDGIKLGQGSPVGEAHLAFQRYILNLSRRGVILAVCSKNDEKNALEPFEQHNEMVLKREHIAHFVANWNDKASNLRFIAQELNIGIDSLVFVDDNPFERNQVRSELPQVAVPELPVDPAYYAPCLSSGGYFEAIAITHDDLARTQQYQANAIRISEQKAIGNIDDYLSSLDMLLEWSAFDDQSLTRVTQLINKTNQFNLTTQRLSRDEVEFFAGNPDTVTLQLRLLDKYGDNGIISIIIANATPNGTLAIHTWLMSCRVLGRGVENATLGLLIAAAKQRGISRLVGEYLPTEKNGMVADHYKKLGFSETEPKNPHAGTTWELNISNFLETPHHITLKQIPQS